MQRMLDQGISTRRGVMCSHREEPYAGSADAQSLPESEGVQDRGVMLPLQTTLTDADVAAIGESLAEVLREAR
jgi:dTDP-4-amino-4,6-dideoxygalactose transaminase